MIKRFSLVGLCLSLAISWAQAETKRYSLSDLQALDQRKAWDELVMHLQDVPPAQRGADWNRVAEHACLRDGIDSELASQCQEPLMGIMEFEPTNTAFAWKAGKWARTNLASWAAVPFFLKAFPKAGDARCKEEDVSLAVVAGLGLPTESRAALVKQSQDLAFQKCWPATQSAVKKELESEGGYFRDNACPGLKKKQALSAAESKFCAK